MRLQSTNKGEANMDTDVTFDSLLGEHMLSGVDLFNSKVKQEWGDYYEDCQCISFVLDGVTYAAIEDPSDGYRSSMESLKISDHEVKNVFSPIRVVCKKKGNEGYHDNDTLQFIAMNGRVVMEVGTDNADDYYPWFVAFFDPTAIPVQS